MKNGKNILNILCLMCAIFLLLSNLQGESTLISLKKGGEANRIWAVLYFDTDPVWAGVSQMQENKLSLYLAGSAGELNGSTLSLDPIKGRKITINQLSQNPAIFSADIMCEGHVPLVILKNEGHIIIALNDLQLLDQKLSEPIKELSLTPSHLVSVVPSIQNDQVMTSFQFDGEYAWKGYVRPSNQSAALLIQGAQQSDMTSQYDLTEGSLNKVRIVTERGRPGEMKVVLFFNRFSHFTIASKQQSLIVQTPYTGEERDLVIAQSEAGVSQSTFVSQRETEVELPVMDMIDNESAQEMIDEMMRSLPGQEGEEEPAGAPEAEDEGIYDVGFVEREPLSDETASISPEIIPADQIEEVDKVTIAEEETEVIPWNQKVSFRFSGTPIKDVLRLIATSNGLNMIVGEGVTGEVTMNLQDVTLRQALEKVVYMQDCEFIVDDNIIIVKPMNVKYLGGMITKVYRLKYSDAKNVAVVVRRMVTNDTLVQVFYPEFLVFQDEERISEYAIQGGGGGGMGGAAIGGGGAGGGMEAGMNRMTNNPDAIQGIRRSSILVVTDRPDRIREVDKVIEELDQVPVQFIIESRLVELRPSYNKELGIDWEGALSLMWNKNTVDDVNPGLHIQEGSNVGLDWQLQTGKLSPIQYTAVLDFLKEKTDSQLKLNPRILAMNNEESSISVGTTVPIPTIQSGGVANTDRIEIDYKEINIQLNVAPHLGENGEITMYVNPVVEEISDWVDIADSRVPVTTKQSVNSIVTVKNGETIVIGGLIKNQRFQLTKKIWFLGDLPLIGKLFQHESVEDQQTELMIFITPKIVEMG